MKSKKILLKSINKFACQKQARQGSKLLKNRNLVALNDWFWAVSVNAGSKFIKICVCAVP